MGRYSISENMTIVQILESWATIENPMNSLDDILAWVKEKNQSVSVNIRTIDYDYDIIRRCDKDWYYDDKKGEIRNKDRTFFQITGLRAESNRVILEQPIILQQEIGYLGIIGKVIDGVLYFLMQAKIEPGNVNKIQISPTIQATKSNFMQAHGGRTPAYLEYFSNSNDYEVVVDQIQSEQSSRFWGKRNRNIVIIVEEDVPVLDSHKWMTLGQIKALMKYDNLVNMDTRTVISCIPFSLRDFSYKEMLHIKSLFTKESFFNSIFFGNAGKRIHKIYQYINDEKMMGRDLARLVPLLSLQSWAMINGEFQCPDGEFSIIFCDIEIEGREVKHWRQPLLKSKGESIFGLIYYVDRNVMKFLISTKCEVGCFDKIECAPTVQIGPKMKPQNKMEKFFCDKLKAREGVIFEGVFSEEGGRFYHEENRNVILQVSKDELPELPKGYFSVDFQTLNVLIQFNNCLNIQLRNLLSMLSI